ncbi:hypothetical protein BASA81_000370 [Batrachochytrium salamandrivorans]|nr:hypothetical protein BASA81_000370 [Batrachochytrium salamandrivorans]
MSPAVLYIVTKDAKLVASFEASIRLQQEDDSATAATCAVTLLGRWCAAHHSPSAVRPLLSSSAFALVQLSSLAELPGQPDLLDNALVIVDGVGDYFPALVDQVRAYGKQPIPDLLMLALVSGSAEKRLLRQLFKRQELPIWLDVVSARHSATKILQCLLLKQSLVLAGFLS